LQKGLDTESPVGLFLHRLVVPGAEREP